MPNGPLTYKKLIKKLKKYGIVVLPKRGKGSEGILLKPESPNSKKGPQIPIKHHGDSTEYSKRVIQSILRRFDIPEEDFWKK